MNSLDDTRARDSSRSLMVGSFPYKPGMNPYQRLITNAIEEAGLDVVRIPPQKWFPLQKAFATDCDVLHLDWPHDWYSGKNAVTRFIKRSMYLQALRRKKKLIGKTKLVWTAHNLVAHDSTNQDEEHRMIQALINQCDGIMVMSKASQTLLANTYQVAAHTSVALVHHGHYADCYPNQINSIDSRSQLGIPNDDQVFLTVGSVRPYKGHLNLIKNFGDVATSKQRLIIAGSSNNADYLKIVRAEAEKVAAEKGCKIDTYLEFLADDRLQVFFNAADFCVLPFESVLNSGSMLLAMSFGVPVLAPRVGSIPEIALPEFSVLYDPGEKEGIQTGLIEAASRRYSLTNRLRYLKEIKHRYSWTSVGQKLANWYREMVFGLS